MSQHKPEHEHKLKIYEYKDGTRYWVCPICNVSGKIPETKLPTRGEN